MPQTTAYMCEDCMERIPYSQTHVDNLGDRYHIDERTGNPHPIFEEIVTWDCSCHMNPPCGGCVTNNWGDE